ncbi:hypothetical protein [Stappia sp.]|uniref:hypothetical protein n=1 Tax=Stappia sp. TaxID=1870903 RepID=UPI003C79D659
MWSKDSIRFAEILFEKGIYFFVIFLFTYIINIILMGSEIFADEVDCNSYRNGELIESRLAKSQYGITKDYSYLGIRFNPAYLSDLVIFGVPVERRDGRVIPKKAELFDIDIFSGRPVDWGRYKKDNIDVFTETHLRLLVDAMGVFGVEQMKFIVAGIERRVWSDKLLYIDNKENGLVEYFSKNIPEYNREKYDHFIYKKNGIGIGVLRCDVKNEYLINPQCSLFASVEDISYEASFRRSIIGKLGLIKRHSDAFSRCLTR